jgi:hypothetical protein
MIPCSDSDRYYIHEQPLILSQIAKYFTEPEYIHVPNKAQLGNLCSNVNDFGLSMVFRHIHPLTNS